MRWLHRHWSALLLVILVFVLRYPSYLEPHWYGDEDIYLTIGKHLKEGGVLYSSIIDHKPPLIYWLAAFLGSLGRMKLFLSLSVASTAIGILSLSRQLQLSKLSTVASLTFFLVFSTLPLFEGNVFNAELLFISLTTWGMYFCLKGIDSPKQLIVSGMFFSLAILTKIPAMFDLGAVGLMLICLYLQKKYMLETFLQSARYLIGGLVLPFTATAIVLFVQGNFTSFISYAVLYNFKYMEDWSTVQFSPLIQFLSPWCIRIGLTSLILVFIWLYTRYTNVQKLILSWFWLGLFGTLLSLRPYAHYFLQLLPATALLMGFIVATKVKIIPKIFMLLSVLVIWILINYLPVELFRTKAYYTNFLRYTEDSSWENYAGWFHGSVLEQYQISKIVNENTTESDSLFVWANAPVIYALTAPFPATRFITDYHVWSFNGFEEVYQKLDEQPPRIIIDCRGDMENYPRFKNILADYEQFDATNNCRMFRLQFTDQMLQ